MFESKKLRLVLAASAISTAAMACGGAPDETPAPTAPKAYVFSAKSSATSRSALGVSRWHSTVEPGATGAITIDGQDGTGRVKFLTTANVDKKTSTVHIQVVLPQRGELVWSYKDQKVVSNNLPASAEPFARAIFRDFPASHPAGSAYGFWGGAFQAAAGVAMVVGGAVVFGIGAAAGVGGAVAVPGVGAVPGAVVAGVGGGIFVAGLNNVVQGTKDVIDGMTSPATSPAVNPSAPAPVVPADVPALPAQPASPATADPSAPPAAAPADPNAPPAAPAPADPNATPTTPAPADPNAPIEANANPTPSDPGTAVADATPSAPAAPTDLPPDNAGGNLDTMGTGTMTADNSSGGASDPGTSTGADPSGGGTSDPSGGGASDPSGGGTQVADNSGGGGGDVGGGGGGGDSAAASNICKKVAVSKTSKIRACVHY